LEQLHYLGRHYPERLQKFALEAQEPYYPFACGCFNITQMLVVFFHLHNSPLASPVPGAPAADSKQVQHFITVCQDAGASAAAGGHAEHRPAEQSILHELFCALVEGLHDTWKGMSSEGVVTLMDFPEALRVVHSALAAFWSKSAAPPRDFGLLRCRRRKASMAANGMALLLSSARAARVALLVSMLWVALWRTQGQLRDELHEVLIKSRPDREVEWHNSSSGSAAKSTCRHGSHQAPELPCPSCAYDIPPVAVACLHRVGPCARPSEDVDVDAALQKLGVDVADAVTSAHEGSDLDSQALPGFLDQCLKAKPDLWGQPAAFNETKEVRAIEETSDRHQPQDIHAFLDGCLITTCAPGVLSIDDASVNACSVRVWDDFGSW